jgi:hypothetical protein
MLHAFSPLSVSFHGGCPYSNITWGMNSSPFGAAVQRHSITPRHEQQQQNNNYNMRHALQLYRSVLITLTVLNEE